MRTMSPITSALHILLLSNLICVVFTVESALIALLGTVYLLLVLMVLIIGPLFTSIFSFVRVPSH